MSFLNQLAFGLNAKVPLILQTESTECGLACLAMVAGFYGYHTDLASLRIKYAVSQKGSTLTQLIHIASGMKLGARPLRLELEDIQQLKLPCILHWDLNHFVVLQKISNNKISIIDPARGLVVMPLKEASKHFTGVALELWPTTEFEKKEEIQELPLWGIFSRVQGIWRSLGQILVLALVLEVFSLISPLFMQWVIDHVISSNDRSLLLVLVIGFAILMLLQQCINLLRSWIVMYMGVTLNIQWRANVFSHLINLPVHYFEKRSLGDIVSRFGSIDVIQGTLTTTFITAILDGLMTIFTLVLMFMYSPQLACIAIVTMVLYMLIRWVWYGPLRRATEEQIIHAAKQNSHFMETVRGAKAIKLYQRQDVRRSSWLSLLVNQVNAGLTTQKLGLAFSFINQILFGLENILIIWLGTMMIMDGGFSVGVFMAFMAYKNQFGGRVSSLIDKYVQLKMIRIQSERLADIVLTEKEKLYGFDLFDEQKLVPSITVNRLKYRYSEYEPYILDDISFEINAEESVVIVGGTGCGKTTLMNVLLGVLPVQEGEILIGGYDVRKIGVDCMRQMVGTVLQDDVLFAGSIAENISFFDPEINMAWVEECARMAAVHTDILQMPMSYQTLVGDMGTVLSGGQKQRVLLARALYKKPKILFLDEATSHLDIKKEKEVINTIKNLRVTRIMIAHRPETIRSADRIIKLKQGQIEQDTNNATMVAG